MLCHFLQPQLMEVLLGLFKCMRPVEWPLDLASTPPQYLAARFWSRQDWIGHGRQLSIGFKVVKMSVKVFGRPRLEGIIEVGKMLFPQWEKNALSDQQGLLGRADGAAISVGVQDCMDRLLSRLGEIPHMTAEGKKAVFFIKGKAVPTECILCWRRPIHTVPFY